MREGRTRSEPQRGGATRSGSTLAEVLVGIVVLEVGLVGTAGMVWTAASALERAERLSGGVDLAREVADSLALAEAPSGGSGSVRRERVEAEWEATAEGRVRIVVRSRADGEVLMGILARPPRPR